MAFKTILIGLGNIGLKYDINTSNLKNFQTHAKVLNFHSNFDLIAGIDKKEENRNIFYKM